MENGDASGSALDGVVIVGRSYMLIESNGGNGSYITMGSVSWLINGANGTFSLKSDKIICRKIGRGGVLYLNISKKQTTFHSQKNDNCRTHDKYLWAMINTFDLVSCCNHSQADLLHPHSPKRCWHYARAMAKCLHHATLSSNVTHKVMWVAVKPVVDCIRTRRVYLIGVFFLFLQQQLLYSLVVCRTWDVFMWIGTCIDLYGKRIQ